MYKKVFELSGLSNTDICKRLEIGHTQRIQFEKSKSYKIDNLVLFTKKLGLNPKEVAQLIYDEFVAKCK